MSAIDITETGGDSDVECNHPKTEVIVTNSASIRDLNEPIPQFWTVTGVCKLCETRLEIDFEFHSINEA